MRDVMTLIFCLVISYFVYDYFYGDKPLSGPKVQMAQKTTAAAPVVIGETKFHLTNQFDEKVTEKSFHHSKSLVYFGFTHCPDVCPTALATMTEAYNQLGANRDELKIIFISVDPENDTPDVLQEYLLTYNKDIIGLTGDRTVIENLAKSYKAYANKDDKGVVMHSDLIYLMDENGKYITHFNNENTPEDIVKYIKKSKK